ncbi:unnamed protein product [marine sediment metagenome]|uniref:Uncharacterized protein n=1 Tax=marine sediment metagenome TaxID=412755 RepID=X1I746_9ZZZZ
MLITFKTDSGIFTYCEKEEDIIINNKGYLSITNLKKHNVEIKN